MGLLLRDVMMPLPMRPGRGEEMAWPYPGVPAAVVAEFAGYDVAGLPFFLPETVTTDHGAVYTSHHLVEVERRLSCSILPARTMRATDKAACERAFRSARTLLFEALPSFRGVYVADRGADPESDAVFTLSAMEHLVATWIVKVWQNRRLGQHAPPWAPDQRHSPNTLFASSFAQGGFGLRIPSPATPLVAAAVCEMADRLLRSPDEATASAALGPLAAEARYVSRKVSYSIRRGSGTSVPLQTALLAHR